MNRLAPGIRALAVLAVAFAYVPVVGQLLSGYLPDFGAWAERMDTGPLAMGVAAACILLAVATPGLRGRLWNNALFALVFLGEFCLWSSAIANVLRTEIYFYDSDGISLILAKRGLAALTAFATAACFAVGTSVTRVFTAIFLIVVIAFDFITILPEGDVISYSDPRTVALSLASLAGLTPTGTDIANFPTVGMYVIYACALFHSVFLMDDEDFTRPFIQM